MRVLDGIRIIGPDDGALSEGDSSVRRELVSATETGDRWRLGEVVAQPDERVATHLHPGEPEVIVILEGDVELHGARGVAELHAGDLIFIPPDTEHGLRTPTGGRWLAIWPIGERVPGPALRPVTRSPERAGHRAIRSAWHDTARSGSR